MSVSRTLDARIVSLFGSRLTEFRWLGNRRLSIFADNPAVIQSALESHEAAGLNAYLVINPLRSDVLSRRQVPPNVLFSPLKGQCAANEDALRRDLLPFDFDPWRPTGIAATPEQRDFAARTLGRFTEFMVKAGLPDPACTVDSGNGRHGYFRVSLPNNRETDTLLTSFYNVLARKFDTPEVRLDKSVRSAAQLMRLPGSFNYKAQRSCEIITFDESTAVVTLEQIRHVTDELRGHFGLKASTLGVRKGRWTPELMERFLQFYSIDYLPPTSIPQGTLWVLNPCPLNEDHFGTSPAVIVTPDGFPVFKCLHASCQISWRQFRARLHVLTNKFFLTGLRD